MEEQRERMLEGRERLLIEAPAGTGVRGRFRIEMPTPAGLITDGSEREGESESGRDGLGEKEGEKAKGKRKADGEHVDEEPKTDAKGLEVVVRVAEDADGAEPEDVLAPKKDTRPAGVDAWEFKVRTTRSLRSAKLDSFMHLMLDYHTQRTYRREMRSCSHRMQTSLRIARSLLQQPRTRNLRLPG